MKAGTGKEATARRRARFVEAALTAGYSANGASKAGCRLSIDAYVLSELVDRRRSLLTVPRGTTPSAPKGGRK